MSTKLASINAFIQVTGEVLMAELGTPVRRGQIALEQPAEPTGEVTTLLSFTGSLAGIVLVSMTVETALAIVSRMMGQAFVEFDDLALSGIGELGNVISGTAMTLLTQQGVVCEIAPPVVAVSQGGSILSTPDLPRLAIPLHTDLGVIDLHLALKSRA